MSPDVIAVIDPSNNKLVRLYDVMTGKALKEKIEHTNEIVDFALNTCENDAERKIVFLDENRDLFVTPVLRNEIRKIVTMCQSFHWHSEADMLAAAADLRLYCWYYPSAIYVD